MTLLLQYQAALECRNEKDQTALMVAAKFGNVQICAALADAALTVRVVSWSYGGEGDLTLHSATTLFNSCPTP